MINFLDQLERLDSMLELMDATKVTQSNYDRFRQFNHKDNSYQVLYLQSALLMNSNYMEIAGSTSQMEHDLFPILGQLFHLIAVPDPDFMLIPKGGFDLSLDEICLGNADQGGDHKANAIEKINVVAKSLRKYAPFNAVGNTIDKIRDLAIQRQSANC